MSAVIEQGATAEPPAVRPEELRDLLSRAAAGTLPKNRRVRLPSGRWVDDWNVMVRGSVTLLRHARRAQDARTEEREKADMTHLTRVLTMETTETTETEEATQQR